MLHSHVLNRLCRGRELLRDAHCEPLSIAAIAREAGMSPHHFIRQFAAVFGITPHQYRLQARIERAKQLLAGGEDSVTDVCLAVGFSSLGSFSTLFSHRVGVAPTNYRRAIRSFCSVPGNWQRVVIPSCFSLMAGAAGIAIFEKRLDTQLAHSPHTQQPSSRA